LLKKRKLKLLVTRVLFLASTFFKIILYFLLSIVNSSI